MDHVERDDFSRLDAYAAGRRRALQARELWKPALGGRRGVAGGQCGHLGHPAPIHGEGGRRRSRGSEGRQCGPRGAERFADRHPGAQHHPEERHGRDPADHRAAPATPEERAFTGSDGWLASTIRGRIMRQDKTGFVLETPEGGELAFYPARIGADGKVEPNPAVQDRVEGLLGDLAYCRPLPMGTYACVSLHGGQEVPIRQVPVVARTGKPT